MDFKKEECYSLRSSLIVSFFFIFRKVRFYYYICTSY